MTTEVHAERRADEIEADLVDLHRLMRDADLPVGVNRHVALTAQLARRVARLEGEDTGRPAGLTLDEQVALAAMLRSAALLDHQGSHPSDEPAALRSERYATRMSIARKLGLEPRPSDELPGVVFEVPGYEPPPMKRARDLVVGDVIVRHRQAIEVRDVRQTSGGVVYINDRLAYSAGDKVEVVL